MTRRLPTAERREQIVLATLDLLSRHPVSDVTTRLIAEEVGLSQPALFRHFDTRSALFAAVIAHSRDRLRDGADRALAGAPTWDDAAQAIAAVIVEHAGAHPGLPRLYFYDLAASDGAEAHRSLNGLADMQAGLMASLVRQGQQAGDVPPTVDADTAGRVFVALLQGTIAGWLAAAEPDLSAAAAAVRMWAAAVRAGEPAGTPQTEPSPGTEGLLTLDVRPRLARGEEPLDEILATLARLRPDGLLLLTAPFRPGPLESLLGARGFTVHAEGCSATRWELLVCGPSAQVLDLRELEAPEPMEAVLLRSAGLAPGDAFAARVPRVPRLLLPRIAERGLRFELAECADGTAVIYVAHPG